MAVADMVREVIMVVFGGFCSDVYVYMLVVIITVVVLVDEVVVVLALIVTNGL